MTLVPLENRGWMKTQNTSYDRHSSSSSEATCKDDELNARQLAVLARMPHSCRERVHALAGRPLQCGRGPASALQG